MDFYVTIRNEMTSSKSILLLAFFGFVGAEGGSVQCTGYSVQCVFVVKRKSTYKIKMQMLLIFYFHWF